MCEYCNENPKYILDHTINECNYSSGSYTTIIINPSSATMEVMSVVKHFADSRICDESVKVEFCPMCGRLLKNQNDTMAL